MLHCLMALICLHAFLATCSCNCYYSNKTCHHILRGRKQLCHIYVSSAPQTVQPQSHNLLPILRTIKSLILKRCLLLGCLLSWLLLRKISRSICFSQLITDHSRMPQKSNLGKQLIYWACLQNSSEGLLTEAWDPKLLHPHKVPPHHERWPCRSFLI